MTDPQGNSEEEDRCNRQISSPLAKEKRPKRGSTQKNVKSFALLSADQIFLSSRMEDEERRVISRRGVWQRTENAKDDLSVEDPDGRNRIRAARIDVRIGAIVKRRIVLLSLVQASVIPPHLLRIATSFSTVDGENRLDLTRRCLMLMCTSIAKDR